MRNALLLCTLVLPACLWAGSALAEPARDDAAGWLAERDRILSDFGLAPRPAAELPEIQPIDLEAVASVPPQVVSSDVRLALTQMALAAGSAGQVDIAAAQADEGPGAIYLRAGQATMAQLYDATRGTDLEPVLRREGGRYVASRPIVVVQGATLRLEPGDKLELDTASGAFLLNFGHLSVSGATIRAEAPPPGSGDRFRPFVASLGTGTIEVAHGLFVGLGSRIAPVASGLALSSGSLFAASMPSVVRDSRFMDVYGLSALDSNGAAILDNRFDRPRGVAIWSDGSDRVTIAGNNIIEPAGAFAIRVDGPANEIGLVDNVLVGGEHAGLRVAGGAAAVDLQGNVVVGFAGRAIVAEEGAGCLRIAGNLVENNGGDGIGGRDVGAMLVGGNAILHNGGAGLSLSTARGEAEMLVQDNLFAGNRSGIRASEIATLDLSGNDLSDQMPRHLAGDLAQMTPIFLRESRGGARPAFTIHSVRAEVAQPLPPEAIDAAFDQCRVEAGS